MSLIDLIPTARVSQNSSIGIHKKMSSAMLIKMRNHKLIQLAANPPNDDHKRALDEVLIKTRMKGKLDSERI